MKTKTSLLLSLLILSTGAMAQSKGIKVIYGKDNRKDVFESNRTRSVELSRSTAAMVPSEAMSFHAGKIVTLGGKTLERMGICAKEKFSQQPAAALCSGFLVGGKYIVTAGHCITNQYDCASNKWVFDYKVDHTDQSSVNVDASAVYGCKAIIERKLEPGQGNDYAVIELDRPVTDRESLRFRKQGKIQVGVPLVVIGHPSGLPTKIADRAKVRSLSDVYFTANLDTYGGNSGSAVFNGRGMVEGILVRGDEDYIYSREDRCQVSNHCEDGGCRGEDVTYITNIEFLKTLKD